MYFKVSPCVVFGSSSGRVGMMVGFPCVRPGTSGVRSVPLCGWAEGVQHRCPLAQRPGRVSKMHWCFCGSILKDSRVFVNICRCPFSCIFMNSLSGCSVVYSFYPSLIPSFAWSDEHKCPSAHTFCPFLLVGVRVLVGLLAFNVNFLLKRNIHFYNLRFIFVWICYLESRDLILLLSIACYTLVYGDWCFSVLIILFSHCRHCCWCFWVCVLFLCLCLLCLCVSLS